MAGLEPVRRKDGGSGKNPSFFFSAYETVTSRPVHSAAAAAAASSSVVSTRSCFHLLLPVTCWRHAESPCVSVLKLLQVEQLHLQAGDLGLLAGGVRIAARFFTLLAPELFQIDFD